jgi:YggT family protein
VNPGLHDTLQAMGPQSGHFVDLWRIFLVICMVVFAIASWLVAFEVIRLGNPMAHQIYSFLDSVTRPLVRPIQRFMPRLGGVDLSYLVAFLILEGVRRILLPGGIAALTQLLSR